MPLTETITGTDGEKMVDVFGVVSSSRHGVGVRTAARQQQIMSLDDTIQEHEGQKAKRASLGSPRFKGL